MSKRDYGDGAIYQRHTSECPPADEDGKRPGHKCAGRWVGIVADAGKAGFTTSGTRKRVTVTAKTEGEIKRKLRNAKADYRKGQEVVARMTVKAWSEEYLAIRVRDLSPKGYNAAANPIRKWVVPTIGHRRLEDLTARDIRAVQDAQRNAKKPRQPADTHRALLTMLRRAVVEGHHVPAAVLTMKPPKAPPSDRQAMTVDQGLACLAVAAELPHGTRWLCTLLYGTRLGEGLGMTRDSIDLDAGDFGEMVIEWQLQQLPYNVSRDRSSGFRVPDGHESRHLVDSFHLVRPKSKAGYRVAPLLEPVRRSMEDWLAIAPENPWGLVWPNLRGRPANDKNDRAEWHALQATAGVGHPSGRPFHIHECRNFAATMLLDAGVPEHVVTDLLGHSSVAMSLRYRTKRREPLLEAMQRVGERLQLG